MAKRTSKFGTIALATLLLLLCVSLPWLLPSCSFEPSEIGRHPDVDDEDAGDSE